MNESQDQGRNIVQSDHHRIDSLQWICSKWQMQTREGILHEHWTRMNDSLFRGTSYLISGTDTLFSEFITLEQHAGDLFYVPVVADQNNGMPVIFKLISSNDGRWVFENQKHDFPQQIVYSHPQTDSMTAIVAGTDKGISRKEVFTFFRQPLEKNGN